ncbi:single-stranded-DNA-specific exonuclease RecJ, partial [Patescibacteria group bacterium]
NDDMLKQLPEYNQVILQLLYNRGIKEKKQIEKFINPDFTKDIYDPFLFTEMERAVELIIKHIKAQNKIYIFGDYDADGVTATTVLFETLDTLKAKADVYIPDRVSEGYGLNKKAIKYIRSEGARLMITVDNGIRNKDEIAYAEQKGLEVIVTDHHVGPDDSEDLPKCAIINPILDHESYPYRYLSGVGVSLKLASALIKKSKLGIQDKEKLIAQLLDLVAIGTIADCVDLREENRVITMRGLEMLNKTKRLGLKELIKVAKLNEYNKLDSWNIAFQIAPRLNAAGRMEHANAAFELLITKNKEEAETMARRLNSKNSERQRITEEIVTEVEKQVKEDQKLIIGICPSDTQAEAWNEGVIGLVAGRIADKYYRPTLIITKADEGYKGSGRTIEELNIIESLEEVSKYLEKYGGHAGACGFSVKKKNFQKFISDFKAIVNKKLEGIELKPKIIIDTEVDLEIIDEELMGEINKLAPFGQNNEKPKFVSRNIQIMDIFHMGIGGKHIKLRLKSERSGALDAIGFSQAEIWEDLTIGDIIDIVYFLEFNEFNGRRSIQMKIIDIKNHSL